MFQLVSSLLLESRIPAMRTLARAAMIATLVGMTTGTTACSENESTGPNQRLVYGDAQALGQGTARSYVVLDNAGKPASLGVAISETAMATLPQSPIPGMPAAAMLTLTLPAEAALTGFNHVMLDWNPAGHEPEHVYTHPHFDFHFYQITPEQRNALLPTNPDFAAKTGVFPAAEYVPNGYMAMSTVANIPPAAAAVPFMGMHWLDTSSPELQPPPNNKTFTSTFLWGSYDGRFIFLEPMITKAFIDTAKGKPDGITFPLSVPGKVAATGSYPNAYSIKYDAAAKEYRIALDGLVAKQAAQ